MVPTFQDVGTNLEELFNEIEKEEQAQEALEIEDAQAQRGATDGPLKYLIPIFVDIESTKTPEISLKHLTLRQYSQLADIETLSITIGNEAVVTYFSPKLPGLPPDARRITPELIAVLRKLALDPAYIWVGHNMAFDARMLRFKYQIPHPANVWCTMEGAMAAWPELRGGYSLDNCCLKLGIPRAKRKYPIDLDELTRIRHKATQGLVPWASIKDDTKTEIERIAKRGCFDIPKQLDLNFVYQVLSVYNSQDVEASREIYLRQIAKIPPEEQEVALRTHHQRRHHFVIDGEKLDTLIERMDHEASVAMNAAKEYLDENQIREVFNYDDGNSRLNSIRYLRLRNILNQIKEDEEEFRTTSLKKLSPIQLAKNPTPAKVLELTTKAGKYTSHRRRASVFYAVDSVDVELGYARAHTMRFSSPSCGKGLNLHNVPKHMREVAKPVRQTFHMPDHLCLVRGDLANVEYRIVGLLTDCPAVVRMFDSTASKEADLFADPYCRAWNLMTGMVINSKDHKAIRQVAKSAVLGLGFCMSAIGYARVLLMAIGRNEIPGGEETIKGIIRSNNWGAPPQKAMQRIKAALGCSDVIATAAYWIHHQFNKTHPEFRMTAEWLVSTVEVIASIPKGATPESTLQAFNIARAKLDFRYKMSKAPNRNKIGLEVENDPLSARFNVRVRCGHWPSTVCWREPSVRLTGGFGNDSGNRQLTIMKSTGLPKVFTPQLAIENVTQAAARNAMCAGVAMLDKMGYRDCIHIHDEVMLIVPREREAALKAREALLQAFGPKHSLPYKWSILIKPQEVTVTKSLWEDEDDIAKPYIDKKDGQLKGNDRWQKILDNAPGCLDNLP